MKFGLDVATAGDYADPRKLADLAAEAEQAGWDGFFVWDVVFAHQTSQEPVIDPWVTLAAVAMKTQRIRIGAFMTPLARRRPWQVARQTVTLDHLSNGRLVFGAALGYQALDFVPFKEDYGPKIRAEKLDEGLEVLTGLWAGEAFSFRGKHYQVDNVKFVPKPVQSPRIPIWLAGGWPRRKPLQRAARWDGIYLMTVNQTTNELLTPKETREIVAYFKAHRKRTEPFDIAVNVETPSDPKQAAKVVRPYIEAGATWCVELSPDTIEQYRERIRSGPPKV
ncbi:MAG TPA: LLM class flavin-dependent oxidoreductase [Anaerolineae bacterium]|nr:LLM class flavin-dependent oxidoreductase [Anaerolineae bacterium]